jgi:6-phosphofructokinase 1
VTARLRQFGIKTTIVAKNIGYELRCADPVPFDMEYTRDLGYCAAKYIIENGSGVMISMQAGRFVAIPFEQLLDATTGRAAIRKVDVHSTRYAIARRYMIRLRRDDFDDPHELAKFAATAGISLEEFREQFAYLIGFEPPHLMLRGEGNDEETAESTESGERVDSSFATTSGDVSTSASDAESPEDASSGAR